MPVWLTAGRGGGEKSRKLGGEEGHSLLPVGDMTTAEPPHLISHTYVFNITDGRVIQGVLIAIDDQSNLLVTNAVETFGDHQRELGLVSIRRDTIDKVLTTEREYRSAFAKNNVL